MDSVRPGIKSITRTICGYKSATDSTGAVFFMSAQYDAKGRVIKRAEVAAIAMETFSEPKVSSWFYSIRPMYKPHPDTTSFKYDQQGRMTEEVQRHHQLDNDRWKTVNTYDGNGLLVKSQDYVNGKATSWEKYNYDQQGHLLGTVSGRGTAESEWKYLNYDSQWRLIKEVEINGRNGKKSKDSTVTTYRGDTIMSVHHSGSYSLIRTSVYTEYDSIAALFSCYSYVPGKLNCDTTLYTRDPVSHLPVTITNKRKSDIRVTRLTYDVGRLKSVIVTFNDALESETFYDSQGVLTRQNNYSNGKLYSYELWTYNEKGDRTEYRLYNPEGGLVQREVFSFTYY